MLEAIEALVVHESPSRDKPALDALAGRLAVRFAAIGMDVELLPNPAGGDHLRMRLGDPADVRLPALVLCHYDTVWKAGTLATMPFRFCTSSELYRRGFPNRSVSRPPASLRMISGAQVSHCFVCGERCT